MDAWPMIDRCRARQRGQAIFVDDTCIGWTDIKVLSEVVGEAPFYYNRSLRERLSIFSLLTEMRIATYETKPLPWPPYLRR